MKTIAISIEESALSEIDRVARRTRAGRINRSQVIRQAVHEYISRLERQAREAREDEIVRKHHKKLNRQAAALIRQQAKL